VAGRLESIQSQLFSEAGDDAFAVLDGASVPFLLQQMYDLQPEHLCLYRGELDLDLQEAAPWLVRLAADAPFTRWVLEEGWGKNWGIFASAPETLPRLRRHLRRFLLVRDPNGRQLYFRYYDPRVLRTYLPTCNSEELETVFGPVSSFYTEAEAPNTLLRFLPRDGRLVREQCRLDA